MNYLSTIDLASHDRSACTTSRGIGRFSQTKPMAQFMCNSRFYFRGVLLQKRRTYGYDVGIDGGINLSATSSWTSYSNNEIRLCLIRSLVEFVIDFVSRVIGGRIPVI